MSYLVLARKWRPPTFGEVVGQQHVTDTLKNAIRRGRIGHAFLFTGVRGVGKTTIARILARALNCQSGDGPAEEPCGECASCQGIAAGSSVDVFEIDGASNNGVEDVRNLRENAQYLPSASRFKIYIIDEVHMLSKGAFNALLKVLEEPPPHVIFMFATTEPEKVPITVLSRCQRYDLKRVRAADIEEYLARIAKKEKFKLDAESLHILAHQADGSMRDALSLLDQVISFAGDKPTAEQVREILGAVDRSLVTETVDGLLASDGGGVLQIVDRVLEAGIQPRRFLGEIAGELRNLAVARLCPDRPELLDLNDDEAAEVARRVREIEPRALDLLFGMAGCGLAEVAAAARPRLALEMVLVRMLHAAPVEPLDQVLERIDRLSSGGGPRPPATPGSSGGSMSSGRAQPAPRSQPSRSGGARSKASAPPTPPRKADEVKPAPEIEEEPPHPAAPASATTAPTGRTPSPDDWPELLRDMAHENDPKAMSLASMLENARLEALDESQCVLALEQEFHRKQVENRKTQLESMLAERYGRSIRVLLTGTARAARRSVAEERQASREARKEEMRREVLGHPSVRSLQEILGGKVVRINLPDEEE